MEASLATLSDTRPPARVAHLLEVARAEFVTGGFDGVSIDAIARKSGVSKETIYRHFPDKQALFRASLDEMGGKFMARTHAIHGAGLLGGDELAGLARAVLDAAEEGGLLSPSWLAAGLGKRMPDFAVELQRGQAARMEPVREAIDAIARAQGMARPITLDDALDFGSLAVGGSALLMGFAPPEAERRAAFSARVAALFQFGVLGMARNGALAGEPPVDAVSGQDWPDHLRRLLDVAADHFLRDGYEPASLGTIGAEAQVGRGTLYRHFASKAGLFDAVLRDLATRLARDADPPELPGSGGRDAVARYLGAAARHLTGRSSIALHRAAISASRRDPALARFVHDAVRGPWIGPLASWIAQVAHQSDAQWLARQGLVLAMQGNRAISAGRGPAGQAIEGHADRISRMFLNGLGG